MGNSFVWLVKSYLGLKSCHCEQKRSHPEILDRQAESIVARGKKTLQLTGGDSPFNPLFWNAELKGISVFLAKDF